MLQFIRERAGSWVIIGIVIFICIPFLFFGIEGYFFGMANDTVMVIDGEEVSQSEFERSFSNFRQQMAPVLGVEYFEQPTARREFVERMIAERVLAQTARDYGIGASTAEVQREIAAIPAFQIDGAFNRDLYARALGRVGLTSSEFAADVAQGIAVQRVPNALQESAMVPAVYAAQVQALAEQKRQFRYILLNASELAQQIEPTAEEVQAFYDTHPDMFRSEPEVVIEYVQLQPEEISEEIVIDDFAVEELYAERRDQLRNPERRRTSHILFEVPANASAEELREARDRAQQARERIIEGEAFAAVATELSEDPASTEQGGDLGWITEGVTDPSFEEALFALDEGVISEPVRTEFGYHLIRVEEIEEESGQTFAEAAPALREELRESELQRLFLERQDYARDLVFDDESTLEPVADALEVPLERSEPFTRDAGTGIAAEPLIRQMAFSDLVLEDRLNSEAVQIPDGPTVFLRVASFEPAQLLPLEEVRERATELTRVEIASEDARSVFDGWQAALAEGRSLEEVAGDLEVRSTELLGRNDPAVPPALREAAFALEPREGLVEAVDLGADRYAVVALDGIETAAPEEVDPATIVPQLDARIALAEAEAFVNALRADKEIRIMEDRIER